MQVAAEGAVLAVLLAPRDRVAAACKLASLRAPQLGEAAALRLMLAVRERCYTGPSRATWLLHLAEILLRGMLLRQETRAAGELVQRDVQ